MKLSDQSKPVAEEPRTVGRMMVPKGMSRLQTGVMWVAVLVSSGLLIGVMGYRFVNQVTEDKQAAAQLEAKKKSEKNIKVQPLELPQAPPISDAPPIVPDVKSVPPTMPPLSPTPGNGDYDPKSAKAKSDEIAAEQRKLGSDLGGAQEQLKPATDSTHEVKMADRRIPEPDFGARPTRGRETSLSASLVPSTTPDGTARIVGNPHLTLAKGTSISCNLGTAINTDQAGFVTCYTDYPIYSMDGTTVLAERGTKIEGEYTKALERGKRAIFVLWTEATTPAPNHVRFSLLSPGTDSLGRAGIDGEVDTKFWDRFSGALMFSVLQDGAAVAAAKAQKEGGSSVVVMPNTQATGQNAVGEILKQGSDIQPSLTKHQGAHVAITVARQIDFSSVYKLRPSTKSLDIPKHFN